MIQALFIRGNHKCIRRLMEKMRVQSLGLGPNTTKPAAGKNIYPDLLRKLAIDRINQV